LLLAQPQLAFHALWLALIVLPFWLWQRRSHLRVWRQDAQLRQEELQVRMKAWEQVEQQRLERVRELTEARREAERQQQAEYMPRLEAWQQATDQSKREHQERMAAWQEAQKERKRLLAAHKRAVKAVARQRREERTAREEALAEADAAVAPLEQERQACIDRYASLLRTRRRRLDQVRQECQRLEAEYQEERQRLERNREALAREQYLRTEFLIDHDIPNIKASRLQILASYGIESAYDVEEERILAISGFGPALTRNLLQWKQRMLDGFRFDARTGVPEADLRALVQQFQHRQDALFAELERTAGELEAQAAQVRQQVQGFEERLHPLVGAWEQARVNLEVFS
jgi:hypothetical protein